MPLSYLVTMPSRCSSGFDLSTQHPALCQCSEASGSEWTIFRAALKRACGADGRIHQRDMRPIVTGRIAPRRIATCYSRAKREGLIREVGREPSNDERGRNTNKWEPIYELLGATA